MDASSLEMFKARLDDTLSNSIKWLTSLSKAGRLELDVLYGPLQIKPPYDSNGHFLSAHCSLSTVICHFALLSFFHWFS